MKRKFLLLTLSAGMIALIFSSYVTGPFSGGAGNRTGSTGATAECSSGGCHAANNPNTSVSIKLTTLADVAITNGKYTPGTTYKVVIGGTNSTSALTKFGFQATCVKAAATTVQAGTFTSTSANITVRTTPTPDLVEHNTQISATSTGPNVYKATFNWTAPATGTGTVRFYATLNAVNGDNTTAGDAPNTATPVDFTEATTGISNTSFASLSVYPNPASNQLHLKLSGADGKGCSIRIYDITGRTVIASQLQVIDGAASINVSQLSDGNYFVSIQQGDEVKMGSFNKN